MVYQYPQKYFNNEIELLASSLIIIIMNPYHNNFITFRVGFINKRVLEIKY